jgi:phage protein U
MRREREATHGPARKKERELEAKRKKEDRRKKETSQLVKQMGAFLEKSEKAKKMAQ